MQARFRGSALGAARIGRARVGTLLLELPVLLVDPQRGRLARVAGNLHSLLHGRALLLAARDDLRAALRDPALPRFFLTTRIRLTVVPPLVANGLPAPKPRKPRERAATSMPRRAGDDCQSARPWALRSTSLLIRLKERTATAPRQRSPAAMPSSGYPSAGEPRALEPGRGRLDLLWLELERGREFADRVAARGWTDGEFQQQSSLVLDLGAARRATPGGGPAIRCACMGVQPPVPTPGTLARRPGHLSDRDTAESL